MKNRVIGAIWPCSPCLDRPDDGLGRDCIDLAILRHEGIKAEPYVARVFVLKFEQGADAILANGLQFHPLAVWQLPACLQMRQVHGSLVGLAVARVVRVDENEVHFT